MTKIWDSIIWLLILILACLWLCANFKGGIWYCFLVQSWKDDWKQVVEVSKFLVLFVRKLLKLKLIDQLVL